MMIRRKRQTIRRRMMISRGSDRRRKKTVKGRRLSLLVRDRLRSKRLSRRILRNKRSLLI